MATHEISLELAVELVKNAYERVEHFQAKHLETQADPYSDSDDRDAAREAFESNRREFGRQWKNVKRIFEEKGL